MTGPIDLPCDTPEDFIFMGYLIAIVYDNWKGKWYASAESPVRGVIFSPYVTNKQSAISDIKEYIIKKKKRQKENEE